MSANLNTDSRRSHGGPKKRFKGHLKKSLKSFDINPNRLEAVAADSASWRTTCHDGVEFFETALREERRRERHQRAPYRAAPVPGLQRRTCGRPCDSHIDLYSHLRTHRP